MVELSTPQPAQHEQPTVKARKLAYLVFERTDLDSATAFLTDFGLCIAHRTQAELYLRGTGTEPFCYRVQQADTDRFVGFGLEVDNEEDLYKLAKLPEASLPEAACYPGGGQLVRLQDPSGFIIEAICGRDLAASIPHRPALPMNSDRHLPRVNETQRPPVVPPEVIRLGHVVLEVADFQATCGWYTRHFGLIPSDVQVLPDGSPAVAFLRLNLGEIPTDHHTIALAQGFMPLYSHSAYEVVDADAVGMGQRILRERGWKHAWGIGRHLLGSQIFDYWKDPWGAKHEHYCDGDVFTSDAPTGIHPVSKGAMSQWGQAMPADFTKPKITPTTIKRLIHHLRHSPDLSISKLITLAKIFG